EAVGEDLEQCGGGCRRGAVEHDVGVPGFDGGLIELVELGCLVLGGTGDLDAGRRAGIRLLGSCRRAGAGGEGGECTDRDDRSGRAYYWIELHYSSPWVIVRTRCGTGKSWHARASPASARTP